MIAPYDKSWIVAIEKAIQTSDLGINPSNDGTVIRLCVSTTHRGETQGPGEVVKHKAEAGRVAVRNLRR